MRKLASIQKILNIRPIPGADKIEAVDILGWTVVSEKGIHTVGDLVVYFEIDSFLNAEDPRYASFEERFTNWGNKRGMRLKTIRLRKQTSQGLILSLKNFPEIKNPKEDDDVTELLKIEKWESLTEANSNSGGASGRSTTKPFPSFIRKTDQERVQNQINHLPRVYDQDTFEVTIKLDGSSMTVYHLSDTSPYFEQYLAEREERFLKRMSWLQKLVYKVKKKFGRIPKPEYIQGVCSRNIELDIDGDNHFSQYVRDTGILAKLRHANANIAIQGELIAPDIQGNYEKVDKREYYIYDVFDIDKQKYFLPVESRNTTQALGLDYVPVLGENVKLSEMFPVDLKAEGGMRQLVDKILEYAEGTGMNSGVKREGVVYKSNKDEFSFKAISNSYLLKKND